MNRKQRMQNRDNAAYLANMAVTCPECGERGKHWIGFPQVLGDFLMGEPEEGFWTCPNLYGPDGRRIDA